VRDALVAVRDALVAVRDALVAVRDALVAVRDALVAVRDALVAVRCPLARAGPVQRAERGRLPAVSAASSWGVTPRQSIASECARRGLPAVVAGCVRLVRTGEGDAALILALGGPAAGRFLDGSDRSDRYWLRVWGARGLLWGWDDSAAEVIPAALIDDAWRVREMTAKVAAKYLVGDALPVLTSLRADPVQRVRAAAGRAVRLITAAGA
jgi:hypothetical protein